MFDLIYRYDPKAVRELKSPESPDEARDLLMRGNRDFAELTDSKLADNAQRVIPFDPSVTEGGKLVQAPFAAVLACSDARVPTELVFSRGCNELFVVRVAGNVLGAECLGSLRFAVQSFSSLKALVVVGHAGCGAVTGAVDVYLDPAAYLANAADPDLRTLQDQILVTVRVAAMSLELIYGWEVKRHAGYRAALIEAAVVLNAAWGAFCLQQHFRESAQSSVAVLFGSYDLDSRFVRLPLSPPNAISEEEKGLFAPPASKEDFQQLSRRICSGRLVQNHLGGMAQRII